MSLETRREARSPKQKQCLGMLSILDLVRLCAAFGHPRRPLPCRRHCSHGQVCRRERWEPGAASHCCLAMPADEYSRASLSHLVSHALTPTLTLPSPSLSFSPPLLSLPTLTPHPSHSPLLSLRGKLQTACHETDQEACRAQASVLRKWCCKLPSQLNLSASFSSGRVNQLKVPTGFWQSLRRRGTLQNLNHGKPVRASTPLDPEP